MMRTLLFASAVVAAGCATGGLPDEPVLKEYAPVQKVFTPPSGVRIVVQEDRSSPTVVVSSVYGVGATSDPKGVEGLAHFVEHLAFLSRYAGGMSVMDALKRNGAVFNASTGADFTTYYSIAHRDALEQLMQIEAWRLTRTIEGVTEENVGTEREVVRNELRQRRETSVGNRILDELLAQLFPQGHPLARKMAGTHESLQAATLEHARRFVAEHYRPDNCTIVVAGDVDADAVAKMVGKWPAEALFPAGDPKAAPVRPRRRISDTPVPEPPPPVDTGTKRLVGPVLRPTLLIAWSAPGAFRGNDMLLRSVARTMNLSLAFGIDRDDWEDLLRVDADVLPTAQGSILLIEARLKPGVDPERARRRVLDAALAPLDVRVNRLAMKFGRWSAATALLHVSADPISSALELSHHVAATGKTTAFTDSFNELSTLEASDVTDLMSKYITRDRAVAVYFDPESDTVDGIVAASAGAAAAHEVGRGSSANIAGLSPDEIRRVTRVPGVGNLPRFRLAIGLEVVTVQRPLRVVQLNLQFPGGDVTSVPHGLASIATAYSRTTCAQHDLYPVGGALDSGVGNAFTSFSVQVPSGNLANGVAALASAVRCRSPDEARVRRLPRTMKQRAQRSKEIADRPQVRATKAFRKLLYPNHPLGAVDGDPALLGKLTVADVETYLRSTFRPDNAVLVVTGDVQLAEVRSLADRYLSEWSGGAAAPPQAPVVSQRPGGRTIQLFDRPVATQTSVSLGCHLGPQAPGTQPALDLLQAVIDAKTWELRERWGATYGFASRVIRQPGNATVLTISGDVETPQTGPALKALLDMLQGIGSDGGDIKTFTLKRWDVALQFNTQFTVPAALADAVLQAARHRWPADTMDRYPENLAATTRAAVRDALAPCLGREVIVLVGRAADVRPQLQVAGLAVTE